MVEEWELLLWYQPHTNITFVIYSKGRRSIRENLDMIPLVYLSWELGALGNSHSEHTNTTKSQQGQDHGSVSPDVRNLQTGDYKYHMTQSPLTTGEQV